MNLTIREATEADYPAVARLLSDANPRQPVAAENLVQSAKKARTHPLGLHLAQWVAEAKAQPHDSDGEIVGFAGVTQWPGSYHPERYQAMLATDPAQARRGVGTRLAAAVQAHLAARGAQEILAGAYEDEPHAVTFLTRLGFGEIGREFDNVLTLSEFDPAQWQAQQRLPAGFRRASLDELIAEQGEDAALSAFRECFNEARADEPRPIAASPYSLEDIREYVRHPSALPGGIQLAVTQAGEVAALSELWLDLSDPRPVNMPRLNTGLTGTARKYRRHGLALALKLAALDVALARGAQQVWTSNATTNVPMLALNGRLGFRPQPAYIEMKRGSV